MITKDVTACSVLQDPSPVMLRIQLVPSFTMFLCSGSLMLRRKARCPLKMTMTSLSTLCILWRTTRSLKFHGMVKPRLRAGTREVQISAPYPWMRAPVLPIPCAGTIELCLVAQPVIPLSMVAAEGMPIVLEPVRRVSAAAHPKGSTARKQVLPRTEARMMRLVASSPWRWQGLSRVLLCSIWC